MNIKILQCEKGAREARGIAVVIDVFRAFTLEAYLYAHGVKDIIVSPSAADALQRKQEDPSVIVVGERSGRKCAGFDYGNSPSSLIHADLQGKTVIHTTSNGTRGILNASQAEEIITGSFVNAKAAADYIRSRGYEEVSLVCMGREDHPTEEDTLCAEYIRSLLEDHPFTDLCEQMEALRWTEGRKFFDPLQQEAFPQADFAMCIQPDLFNFVIRCERVNGRIHNRKVTR